MEETQSFRNARKKQGKTGRPRKRIIRGGDGKRSGEAVPIQERELREEKRNPRDTR